MNHAYAFAIASVMVIAVASSCASTPPGANPHDMSAAEHREHAAAEEKEAEQHESQYDPNAEQEFATGNPADSFTYSTRTYNPTESHLHEGAIHRDHADAHRKAAEALEKFENEECAKFPPKTRGVCPLLGQIASAENTKDGVLITPVEGVNREAMLAHMRCHLAYAATRGFEGMDACPLYVKGVSIEESDGKIELDAGDPAAIKAVQQRTATHVK